MFPMHLANFPVLKYNIARESLFPFQCSLLEITSLL